jgi:hypothetical protein
MDLGLKGLNAIVTDGTKGIGRRVADLLGAEGANVSICARNGGDISATVAELARIGVKSFGQAIDVGGSSLKLLQPSAALPSLRPTSRGHPCHAARRLVMDADPARDRMLAGDHRQARQARGGRRP